MEIIVWIIGYAFSIGFIEKEDSGFWFRLVFFFIWPYSLGMVLRELMDNSKSNNHKKEQ